jgi:GTP-binding protein
MATKVPIVAIVGRANVGKSSLFNAILKKREAIVANEPGTTRDSIYAKATAWIEQPTRAQYDFWLVDTAGIKDPEDDFEFTIQEQIAQASDSADVIFVVIEAFAQISQEDRNVAKLALKTKKPVCLLVNKADKAPGVNILDFQKLGIKQIFLTSATQNSGINHVLNNLTKIIKQSTIKQDPNRIYLALLGRPNVGKSYLFNSLAKKQQAIVADRAGTTRDINRVTIRYNTKEIELMDTAGIRRSGKIEKGIEKFSVIRSLSAIEQADVCLLLMDANELNTQLDQKIAGMIKESGKGLILVVSKWDSLDKDAYTRDELAPQIKHHFAFVPWAPLILTSAKTGQNVTKIFDLVLDIQTTRQKTYKTTDLNRWLRQITDSHPPAGLKNRMPKLRYIVHEEGNPNPSFKVFGGDTRFLHWSYKRYMERKFRESFDVSGTPIKFWYIDKNAPTPSQNQKTTN